jgi:aminoglycoside phosphotransferase (APT) family kinase protein
MDVSSAQVAEALLGFLRTKLASPSLDFDESPTLLGAGAEAQILGFSLTDPGGSTDLAGVPLVCRIERDADKAMQEMHRSVALHRVLSDEGFPSPRILGIGNQSDGMPAPFVVMEQLSGQSVETRVEQLTLLWLAALLVAAILGVGFLLWLGIFAVGLIVLLLLARRTAGLMAQLHAIPISSFTQHPGLGAQEMKFCDKLDQLRGYIRHMSAQELEAGLDWLYEHVPANDDTEVVCHGDFHGGNVLIDRQGITGMLDWSRSVIAPREFELAWTRIFNAFIFGPLPGSLLLRWLHIAYWQTHMTLIWAYLRLQAFWYSRSFAIDAQKYRFYIAYHALLMLAVGGDLCSGPIPQRRLRRYFSDATGVEIPMAEPKS